MRRFGVPRVYSRMADWFFLSHDTGSAFSPAAGTSKPASYLERPMQISHSEVRRHPIWQREVHHERQIAGPSGAISPRGRMILAVVVGIFAFASILVSAA